MLESDSPETGPYQVLLYYLYFPLEDPVGYAEEQRELCRSHDLRGRILVGKEGINGTVSGPREGTDAYISAMQEDPRTAAIVFKTDPASSHVFPKLSVKVRDEIVTLGLDSEEDIDPNRVTGERLTPAQFREAMGREDTVLLDGRNDYETDLGRFEGAICPPLGNFRDFPAWLRENAPDWRGKKILTYCTGGIRCEKLSGFLLREGFEDVAQLEGGIVSYAKDPATRGEKFEGLCYVFDERIGVEVNHTEGRRIVSRCRYCNEPEPAYANCRYPDCNKQIFVCPRCREKHGLYCEEACRSAHLAVPDSEEPLNLPANETR